jgi:hypothetical protein
MSSAANPTTPLTIIDTRPSTEFGICSIPGSVSESLPRITLVNHAYVCS